VLLLSTRSLDGAQVERRVLDALGERCAGVSRDCAQHVPLDAVDRLIAIGRDVRPDLLVTVGGGSVTDAAKALAAALAQDCADARAARAPDRLRKSRLPRPAAHHGRATADPVRADHAQRGRVRRFGMTYEGTKDLYDDARLTPRVVVLDPAATRETPRDSGIRALDHAIEIYLSGHAACMAASRA